MAEPFKNNFSATLVFDLGNAIAQQCSDFQQQKFVDSVLTDFDTLELKQRSVRITDGLCGFMPQDLTRCKRIIEAILHPDDISEFATTESDENGLRGWVVMPLADFVSHRWLKTDFIEGLRLLKTLTSRFSAEFAIRDFILFDQSAALHEIISWLDHPNEHVRRLACEGTRPRLPWGKQLFEFVADPTPLNIIFETLLDDESEYVRRSVANNLNDIAKDHPEFVMEFAAKHKDISNKTRMRLLKHACRSLFKQGDARTLSVFGFKEFTGHALIKVMPENVEWGGDLHFEIEIETTDDKTHNLMLDYVIWHQKAKGQLTPKVFKWKVIENFNGQRICKKKHSFKPVTTRKYYPGEHKIEIQINGKVVCEKHFMLLEGRS